MDGFWTFLGCCVLVALVAEVSYAAAVALVIMAFGAWLASRVLREVTRSGRRTRR